MNFGSNIKKVREKISLSQKELADKVGITQSMICQIEKNLKIPSVAVGYEIAKALEVSLDELCKGA